MIRPAIAAFAMGVLLTACGADTAAPLPTLSIDPSRIAVAGISSGAAMAHHVHLAYSDHLIGAALLAGPPYHCAQGKLDVALSTCMKAQPAAPDTAALAAQVREFAQNGKLAPLSGLQGDRVLLMHGTADVLVATPVTRALHDLYVDLSDTAPMQVQWSEGPYAHTFPTLDAGGDCATTVAPYLGKCGIDAAGEMMRALYGEPSTVPAAPQGTLSSFDQAALVPAGAEASVGDTGYLYLPPRCTAGEPCGLLIAFHGCEQNVEAIGEVFVRDAGFNRWADVYDVAVLYPQSRSSYMPLNPKGCWDWWGYTGAGYDTRDGAQVRFVASLTAALGAKIDP